MVRALIMNLILDPQKSEEEKLATGQMPSQYPPMTSHMARARREIHHHLTRITLSMDTSKTMLLPAIRPKCRHQSIRRSKSQREESSYVATMANEDEAVTLDAETIRHDGKLVETTDPSKGNDLAMTTARTIAATRISIALPAAMTTKGKAPATMTMIHLHGEQREAAVAAEINRRMMRVKDMTLRHPHQAAPMAAAVAAAAQQNHATLARIRRTRSPTTRIPTFFLGPKCFGQWIRDEPIPHGFKIEKNIRQYNGVDRPLTWLQDYFNAVQFAGGSPNVAVRYLPLMLSGTARQWINDLAENCWNYALEAIIKMLLL
jgi:hypothetical protein